ncbi:hypothetical protein PHLH6_58700 [Pseudomonas sp. Seg1]|uniref:toll/interleukin-1 receptor domain-containing protein n=1 Tax=Pseudomonas sp. Seg1 TaxID=2678259 RepID=UPI001BB3C2D4|nr:toll/interleukin-1 receptor domain-containing protein [Pseudomonas sp. Seg1]BBP73866.1 hypothetical protein PHLH6_58700 [Pseudomonas sp. Seg1]
MTVEENRSSIFISYAWGAGFENKEWVRQHIVSCLNWSHDVFWDRDNISYGELPDVAISKQLAKRPITVLCLCDQDYLRSAKKEDSGLSRELQMLAHIVDQPGVRVIPLILEADCVEELPAPLTKRIYLDLQPLLQRNIDIGVTVVGLAEGYSQAAVQSGINEQMAGFELRERAENYLGQRPLTIWGNGRNHEVTVYSEEAAPYLLKPPQWMWESDRWNYMLNDDGPTFCPTKGVWHWEYCAISLDIRPLSTAVVSTFFPQLISKDDQGLLNTAGMLLASKLFKTFKIDEAFRFVAEDLINFLITNDDGFQALKRLLDAADAHATVPA